MATATLPPKTTPQPATHLRIFRWILLVLAVCVAAFVILLAIRWPFTRNGMIQRLEKASSAKVEFGRFHGIFFPYFGCVAEDVVFRQAASPSQPAAQIITVHKLTIESTLFGLLSKPGRIKKISAEGLRIQVPEGGANFQSSSGAKGNQVIIEQLTAENALLEIAPGVDDHKPLVFEIHQIDFRNVGERTTIPYKVSLRMPLPPGEVESSGWIGPWKDDKGTVRSTALSGTYTLQHADLSVFKVLGGEVSSRGEFSGTLDRLNISGNTDTPQFEVTASGHRFHLTTQFRGSVDLKTGDVLLPTFQARFGETNLTAQARVAGSPKTVALDVSQGSGQIQDLLLLFSNAKQSPVTGPITFETQTSLPPEHRPFKERVRLTGTFHSDPVKFTSANTQKNVDKLSERAEGKKDKGKDSDPPDDDTTGYERVLTKLTGQVRLVNGVANFSRVSFTVPGAHARMNGTYSLLNKRINFHGDLRMEATVSQATTGKKSFFLKVLDPFFKKKHAGAQVPITMTGVYGQTHFGVGLK